VTKKQLYPSDDEVDKLISVMLWDCVKRDADAVLIEPREKDILVQLRGDKVRYPNPALPLLLPLRLKEELTKRLKEMGRLDPEKKGSQADIIRAEIGPKGEKKEEHLFRILCRPVEHGEHITLTLGRKR
jgi:type II secretory ATPase GspE/PulE/Tfp pilus assembly ATPase PilB-like protein